MSRYITTEDALRMMKKIQSSGGGGASSLTDLGITATADELNFVKGVKSSIQTQLNNKAASDHNHDTIYAKVDHTHTGFATSNHNHDTVYSKLDHTHTGYAPSNHNHDTVYSKLGHTHTEYAASGHGHTNYVDLSSAQTITGTKTFDGEVITNSANAFRSKQGNYGFFIRNDGSNVYFMLTNSGDSGGSWNGLRPLSIACGSGAVQVGNGLTANTLNVTGTSTLGRINASNVYLSGSLYVGGKTSTSDGKTGVAFGASGNITMQGSSAPALNFIAGTDTSAGVKISGTSGTLTCTAGSHSVILTYDSSNGYFRPNADGKINCGSSSYKWYRLYASSSSVQTSDEREKSDIKPIEEGNILEQLFTHLKPKTYKLNVDQEDIIHIGFIAQDVAKALTDLGIGENELAMIEHNYWTDEETGEEKDRYGMAYSEFTALNTYMIQKQQKEIEQLKKEVQILKG